jgi:beta-lactamase class A
VLYFLPIPHDKYHGFLKKICSFAGAGVRVKSTSFLLRGTSLVFIAIALVLTAVQLVRYSIQRSNYPPQMTIGGVPMGGLDADSARERLLDVYSTPVELQYNDAIILLDPSLVGFELNLESMLAAADMRRTGASFWTGFWDYLWNRTTAGSDIPLVASISKERLRAYLQNEISNRYDQLPVPAQAVPGSPTFLPGQPGQVLDIERAMILIEDAIYSSNNRTVVLSTQNQAASRPSLDTLKLLLENLIENEGFTGIIGFYMLDLQSGEELHFGLNNGSPVPVNPDIAFTAASTIKIPIMVSAYRYSSGSPDETTSDLLTEMIKQSDNPPADELMSTIDSSRGPLIVTEDMQALKLQNTFLAGFFCDPLNPCPLLMVYTTPSNQRTDINTNPDAYNQTTPSDMGMLLEDLYQCAQSGGGALTVAFPGQFDQAACQQMIQLLEEDKIGVLIQAGVPEGTAVAHKHGWVTDTNTGIMYNVSDAAIVYSPGGNYILSIYTYHPDQIIWDQVSHLFSQISQAVYNYFNLPE